MKSDKQVYEIFEAAPHFLLELLGRSKTGPCRLQAITIKAIERQSDGVLIFEDPSEAVYCVEWQFYSDNFIYNRVVVAMAVLQEQYPDRPIEGIIIFGSRDIDPQTNPWRRVIAAYYLNELLDRLSANSPDHPLIALFQPLIETDKEKLQKMAGECYNRIDTFETDERIKSKMLSVYVDWLIQRFKDLGKKEIEEMLVGQLTDLRETQAGKELIALGKAEGIKEGIKEGIEEGVLAGKVELLQQILGEEVEPRERLIKKSLEELSKMVELLQAKLTQRGRLS